MSSRVPTGASQRSGLFEPSGNYTPKADSVFGNDNPAGPGDTQQYGGQDQDDGNDMMELEHVIGYSGHYLDTLHMSPDPNKPNTYYMPVGSNVVICNMDDPHDQQLLRGHDEEITALAVSNRGSLLASGQKGSTKSKGNEAPVLVWDLENGGTELYQLLGHTHGILRLAFSPDERFLVATGDDCLMYVWDMQTGEVVAGKKSPKPITLCTWGAVVGNGRRPTYNLSTAFSTQVMCNTLQYDLRAMGYQLDSEPCTMPTTGLVRDYHVSKMTHNGEFLVAGTSVGDFVVFNTQSRVFRASVPVSSNGVLSVAIDEEGNLFLGAGDGMIKKMAGRDMTWELLAEVKVQGKVVSLSISSDGTELIAGTSFGKVYKAMTNDLSLMEVSTSHIDSVVDVAFGSQNDTFGTISKDGSVRIWDLHEYSIVAQNSERCAGTCISYCGNVSVTTGWEDGFIRNFDAASGMKNWELSNAHKGAVTAIVDYSSDQAHWIVSGGADGYVRVWNAGSDPNAIPQLLCDFGEHKGAVTQVLIDNVQPWLVHSCGGTLALTYDLKKERRTIVHSVREGLFTGMTQRVDSEQELVTISKRGDTLEWDCDEQNPVGYFEEFGSLKGCQMSSTGNYLATCSEDSSVKVWHAKKKQLVALGVGHSHPVTRLHWSPDEKQLVSVDEGCAICVWNFYGAN